MKYKAIITYRQGSATETFNSNKKAVGWIEQFMGGRTGKHTEDNRTVYFPSQAIEMCEIKEIE